MTFPHGDVLRVCPVFDADERIKVLDDSRFI